MDRYEGVEFGEGIDDLVADQLEKGLHRHKQDRGPGDWLLAAWEAISDEGRRNLALAVHNALLNESSLVRAGALGILDVCGRMVIPEILLDMALHHFELFAGLRHPNDPPERDRGRDLVRLVSACCAGKEAERFLKGLSADPVYGNSVLLKLAQREPAWILNNLKKLVNPEIDPDGLRLPILVRGILPFPGHLEKMAATVVASYPQWREKLRRSLLQEGKDEAWVEALLGERS